MTSLINHIKARIEELEKAKELYRVEGRIEELQFILTLVEKEMEGALTGKVAMSFDENYYAYVVEEPDLKKWHGQQVLILPLQLTKKETTK